jgi:hypothetical protein
VSASEAEGRAFESRRAHQSHQPVTKLNLGTEPRLGRTRDKKQASFDSAEGAERRLRRPRRGEARSAE